MDHVIVKSDKDGAGTFSPLLRPAQLAVLSDRENVWWLKPRKPGAAALLEADM